MTVRCESCTALGFNYDKFNPYVFLSYYSHLPHSFLSLLFCSGKNVDLYIISQQLRNMITKCSLVCILIACIYTVVTSHSLTIKHAVYSILASI